jgi:hypothetical protein
MTPHRRVELLAEHLYRNDGRHLAITSRDEILSLSFRELDPARQEDYRLEARGILAWLDEEYDRKMAPRPRRGPQERNLRTR